MRRLVRGYVIFFTNTPQLVQIYFLYFALPDAGILLSSYAAVLIGMTLNAGAYLTEIQRAGFDSVQPSEMEAAEVLGFSAAAADPLRDPAARCARAVPAAVQPVHPDDARHVDGGDLRRRGADRPRLQHQLRRPSASIEVFSVTAVALRRRSRSSPRSLLAVHRPLRFPRPDEAGLMLGRISQRAAAVLRLLQRRLPGARRRSATVALSRGRLRDWARRSGFVLARGAADAARAGSRRSAGSRSLFTELFRRIPFLVTLMLVFFVFQLSGADLPLFAVALVSGLPDRHGLHRRDHPRRASRAVHRNQWDAAQAMNFSLLETVRYVVLPQAWRVILPPAFAFFVLFIKDTALASQIGVIELTYAGKVLNNKGFSAALVVRHASRAVFPASPIRWRGSARGWRSGLPAARHR